MTANRTCDECGAALPANAPQGLCPRCLVGMGLSLAPTAPPTLAALSAIRNPQSALGRVRYFGDYELLEEIARGGMGVVYKARQVSLNRIVAVKVLLFGQFASDEFVRRFKTEAAAAAGLQHPNIVAIHEVGALEGQHYFSMDFVEGQNLAERARDNPLPVELAADYVKTIAEAIHYAHQRGVLHRDLKPSNVLIDARDQPYITDFGLAKRFVVPALAGGASRQSPSPESSGTAPAKTRTPDAYTITGQILGTPNYMPPEQASGNRGAVGTYSDVYSLGAILYHLLTGRPPFQAQSLEETLLQLLNSEPTPLRALNPSVPRDLETICLKCLHKDPAGRYSSAQALAEDLSLWRAGEPIQARPASTPERFWRWCRRNPALAAMVLLLGVVAAGSTLAAIRFHRISERARLNAYVAEVSAALHNWRENNPEQALSLLRQQRPQRGETDLRGFEWRYLWRLVCGGHQSLPRHNQVVDAMQFSPDGKLLATYCWDNTLRLWDLETRQKRLELPAAAAAGSFSPDGQLFTFGMTNGSILRWGVATDATTVALTNAGEMLACSTDGKTVVTINREGRLEVHGVDTQPVRFSPPLTVRRYLDYGWSSPAALSPDGRTLAVVQMSQTLKRRDPGIRLWEVTSGAELPFLSENRSIRCFKFSPDGQTLAVGDGLGKVKLWNVATRDFRLISASDLPVLSLAFSPDGRTLATGSSGQIIKLWDTTTGEQTPKTFRGPIGQVWSLAFSPDGKRLASGGRNCPVRIWNLDERETQDEDHSLHSDEWGNFTFSLDSQKMAAGTKNHTVKVWEVETFARVAELPGASYAVAFTRDGSSLLTAGLDEFPQWWDLVAKTNQLVPRYAGSMGNVSFVDLSPDRRVAALGHKDGTIQLLEINSGRDLGTWKGHADEVGSVAFSPRGDQLVSGGRDRSVAVWDIATHRKLGANGEHRGAVCAVAFSHDGKMMASGCGAGTIKLWDPAQVNRTPLASISYHQDAICTLAFSPDGRTLACGSGDGMVKLWNVALRQEVASFKHDGPLLLVVFSPDGNTLATVTKRGTLRLFRAATLQEADAAETP